MLGYGIILSVLFLVIGLFYECYLIWVIKYYGGLVSIMLIFVIFFVIFNLVNIGLLIISNFIGEFFVLVGCFLINSWVVLMVGFGMVLGVGYSLWLVNWILFGNVKRYFIIVFRDLIRKEFVFFCFFVFLMFFLGIYFDLIINLIKVLWFV